MKCNKNKIVSMFQSILKGVQTDEKAPATISSDVIDNENDRKLKKEEFIVVGTQYCLDNINKLACANPDWKHNSETIIADGKAGEKIFRYNYIYKPVKLIPEPENPHDKNAVYVMIAGEKVGYISRGDNVHVLDILKSHDVKYITASIRGGAYKVVSLDKTTVKLEDSLHINVRIGYV